MNSAPSRPDYIRLRTALLANAAFSFLCGSVLTLLSARIGSVLGENVPGLIVETIGIALVPFGLFAAWVATRRFPPMTLALFISVADLAWVVGSMVLIAIARDALSGAGLGLVGVVALVVFAFAAGQLRGIAHAYRPNPGEPRQIRVCIAVHTAGDAETVWRNVADMGNMARFAPVLATSAMRDGETPQVGAVRECSDHAQRRWAERCSRLDASRRELDVEFLAHEPGFPFPFVALRGGWRVQSESTGAVVSIWWEGTLRHAMLAAVLPVLLAWQARRQFAVVVGRMAMGELSKTSVPPTLLSVVPS